MDDATFCITSEEQRLHVLDAIADIKLEENVLVMIKTEKETRSKAQHRLKWMQMGFLAKEKAGEGRGWNAEEWNRVFKGMFIRKLLISQDEQYVDFYNRADMVLEQLERLPEFYDDIGFHGRELAGYINTVDKLISFSKTIYLDYIKTEWLTVKNMHKFMEQLDEYCLHKLYIQLPIPEDLKWVKG